MVSITEIHERASEKPLLAAEEEYSSHYEMVEDPETVPKRSSFVWRAQKSESS